jgi:hypothetical protein
VHRRVQSTGPQPRRRTGQEADKAIFERAKDKAERLGLKMTRNSIEPWRHDARKSVLKDGRPKNAFGFMVVATSDLVEDYRRSGAPLEAQVGYLLDLVSVSHLPLPVKTPEC